MKRRTMLSLLAAALLGSAVASCNGTGTTPDLFVLEELETASAVEDPAGRVERLETFLAGNGTHHWRTLAVRRIYETMAGELGDRDGAEAFLKSFLAGETDPGVRGRVLYRRFAWLWRNDPERARAEAIDLLDADERDFRLFLYLGWYLSGPDEPPGPAERLFRAALERATHEMDRRIVLGALGEFLAGRGRSEEAIPLLREAGGADAAETLGRLLLDRGEREEAIDLFVIAAAGVPASRARTKLDSLYTVVHPGRDDLEDRIMARRIVDGPPLAPAAFDDLDGRRRRLGGRGETAQVIVAWSPT